MAAHSRRAFLTTIGAAAVGLAAGCRPTAKGDVASRRHLKRIGLQLYTVRKAMQADLPGTLARVAEIGYTEVEFAGYFGRRASEIRELLARNGLSSPSTHVSFEAMRNTWRQTLDDSREIGHQWVTIPSVPEAERAGLDAWKRVAAEFNTAARVARDSGLRFAYHNHDVELTPFAGGAAGGNASRPLDVLLSETDPSLVDFEMDLYWVVKGGGDPSRYFSTYGKRFPLIHVKDSAGPPAHAITEVGRGTIDFRRIFADGEKAGIQHFFVEQDDPADPLASIRVSYDYLKALEY